jgi:hypothetical protein
METTESTDAQIGQWRSAMLRNRAVTESDADELEGHLREQLADLRKAGLSDDEAFLIAVRRLGEVDRLTAEYAREHGDRLWKQLSLPVDVSNPARSLAVSLAVALGFAVLAAVLVQVFRVLATTHVISFERVILNASFLVLPVLGAYFMLQRRMRWRTIVGTAAFVSALVLAVNLFPFEIDGSTFPIAALHVPVLLWFVVGFAYLGGDIRSSGRRMDFLRFSGEWAIYYSLIALGGAVLVGLMSVLLLPFGPDAVSIVFDWVVPSGVAGAVIVAAWLVEAKKSIIENLAPVLTAIFTPLFAAMLVIAAVTYTVAGVWRNFDRELLLGFDALLLVVVALVVYGISARDSAKGSGVMDVIRLLAVLAAILLDALILFSMFSRVGEFGFTANRVAALGLNLVLLANLIGTTWNLSRLVAGRAPAIRLERWQTGYLPVYAGWVLLVILALPPIFGFA